MSTDKPAPDSIDPRTRWEKARPWVLALLTLLPLASAVATRQGCPRTVEVLKEVEKLVPVLVTEEEDGISRGGWVNDPEEVRRTAGDLPTKVFADTPAGQTRDLPPYVYLWHAHKKLLGKNPPEKDQNPTGSCVGFGTTTAIERTLAAEIVMRGGHASEFAHFSEEVTYAGSRVEANGGTCPIRNGDGSNGSWAAKWATKYGMVPKGKYGSIDLTEYSASRARAWNYSGVPDELEPTAKKFPVKDATRITNWADAKKALANGYGIQVASSQGFARQRDANGVCRAQGNWAHSMCLDGYHTQGGREYGHIENSWSKMNYHTGPVGWGEPTAAGFWADADVIDRMLREGDSWAYSGAVGFPAKRVPLNWDVRATPSRPLRPCDAHESFALAP